MNRVAWLAFACACGGQPTTVSRTFAVHDVDGLVTTQDSTDVCTTALGSSPSRRATVAPATMADAGCP